MNKHPGLTVENMQTTNREGLHISSNSIKKLREMRKHGNKYQKIYAEIILMFYEGETEKSIHKKLRISMEKVTTAIKEFKNGGIIALKRLARQEYKAAKKKKSIKKLTKNKLNESNFIKFAENVYSLFSLVTTFIRDTSKKVQITAEKIFLTMFYSFVCKFDSLLQIDDNKDNHALLQLLDHVIPSDATLARRLAQINTGIVRQEILYRINKTAKRNKAWDSSIIVAIDGSVTFTSKKRHCNMCHEVRDKEGNFKYYCHKVVMCMIVSVKPYVILDIQQVPPDKGEITVAKEMIRRLYKTYKGRFAKAITVDGIYASREFINEVTQMQMNIVIKIRKDDARDLTIIKDAERLINIRKNDPLILGERPDDIVIYSEGDAGVYYYKAWDVPFLEWDQNYSKKALDLRQAILQLVRRGYLRVLYVNVKYYKSGNEHSYWIITTLLPGEATSKQLVEMARMRWRIENNGFRYLKQYFNMRHCYCHHEIASEVVLLIIAITYNLLMLFIFRHLYGIVRLIARRLITLLLVLKVLAKIITTKKVGKEVFNDSG